MREVRIPSSIKLVFSKHRLTLMYGRCYRAGLSCEGYRLFVVNGHTPPEYAASRSLSPAPERVIPDFQASQRELQAYAAYRDRAICFGEPFGNGFWRNFVLQVASCAPAIRYCIFALGSLTQHVEENGLIRATDECRCSHCRFALTSYNKAIANINDPALPDDRTDVALLACVMFICLEMLQGSNERVLDLVEKGYRLIHQSDGSPILPPASESSLRTSLYPVFGRLRLLAQLFGRPISQLQGTEHRLLQNSSVLEELCDHLYQIMGRLHPFVISATMARWSNFSNSDVIELFSQQMKHLCELSNWYSQFTQYCSTSMLSGSPKHSSMTALLEVNYIVTKTWLSTALSVSQMAFEKYHDDFSRAIDLAASMLESALPRKNAPAFVFESGFMPPLFFIANKCRDPALRRRAVALLELTGRREAAWDRAEVLAVARRVIELEEAERDDEVVHSQDSPRNVVQRKRFEDVQIGQKLLSGGKVYAKITYYWMDASSWLASNEETLKIY